MANTLLFTLSRELDVNGVTVPGAKAYFYEAGTTTPISAYSDQSATIAHPVPLEADAGGLFAACYVTASTAKVVITKADDSALRTIDPAPILSLTGVGASGVSFVPTVDIPETNVQDAIETAAATAASGFAAFGIGITGNAPTLADIDATNIGIGFYRTTAATIGTFPTGIAAVDTSIVRMERETAAMAVMTLLDDSGKTFQRFMIASVWGAWRHLVTMPASPTTGDIVQWNGTAWAAITAGASGTVLKGNGVGVAASFGAPAAAVSATLLGTITTTSGTTATLGSLDLTTYKFLRIVANGVSTDNSTSVLSFDGDSCSGSIGSAASRWYGGLELDLGSGAWWSSFGAAATGASGSAPSVGGSSGYSTATTSISFTISPGNFDAGSFRVYGVT